MVDRLAVYGSLRPGQVNAHELAGITGSWAHGTVRGRPVDAGWAHRVGYPGLVLDPDGADVPVEVLTSHELDAHWRRLDEFEGADYCRTRVVVRTADGDVEAWLYAVAD